MINTILATKTKMSQVFEDNHRLPVTEMQAGPCTIVQIKNEKKDGYWAVQLGFGEKRTKNITKPLQGHLRGATKENKAPRFLREVRLESEPEAKVGDTITLADVFSPGDTVSVTGISKGKGFAGVMKRWNFAGGPRTHGQSDRGRAPGSIGQGTDPGRVRKGKKMAGRMGGERKTIDNLKVVSVDPETNTLVISGPVAGANGGLMIIRRTSESKVNKDTKKEENNE